MADGRVTIEAVLDSQKFKRGLKDLSSMSKKGLGIATKAVAMTSVGLVVMGGAAIKAGASFEEGMSKVQAVSQASSEDMEKLKAVAKKMGAETKFSAREAADALGYMGMAGWKSAQMVDALPGVMNLAAASGEDLAMVSDIVTDSMTAFGLEANQSGHFADVLAQASASANTNVAMLGESFKYVAPVAGSFKYTAEDTALALGLMANAGIKSSQAGTSLRSALTRLAKPTKQVQQGLDKYGISITDAHGKVKPLRDLLGEMRDKMQGLSEAEKVQAATMMFGKEAMSGMLAIINTSDEDFNKLAGAIDNADGSAEKMAKTMQNNLRGQITILKSSLEGIAIEIYESVNSPLTKTVKSSVKAVNSINNAFKRGGATKASEAFGKILAAGLSGVAKQTPKIVRLTGKVIKSFVNGLYANRGEIVKTAQSLVRAFAEVIASFLPKELGNSVRNLGSIFAAVLRPALKVIGIVLKVANAMSGLIAPVLGAVGAYKTYVAIMKSTLLLDTLAIAKKKALAVIETYSAARKAALTATTTSLTASTVAQTAATTAYSVSAGVAAVATNAFKAALAFLGGPVGLLVVGLGALAGAALAFGNISDKNKSKIDAEIRQTEKLCKEVNDLSDAYREGAKERKNREGDYLAESQMASDLAGKLSDLIAKEHKSAEEKARINQLVAQLNDLYPELNLQYDKEKDKLNMTTKALWKKISAIKAEAKAQAYMELYKESYKQRFKMMAKEDALAKKLTESKKQLKKAQTAYDSAVLAGDHTQGEALAILDKRKAATKKLQKAVDRNAKSIKSASKEIEAYNAQLDKSSKKKIKKFDKSQKTKVTVDTAATAKSVNAVTKIFIKLSGGIKKESKKASKSIKDIPKAGKGVPAKMRSVGSNMMLGLAQGIRMQGANAKSAMRDTVNSLISIAKKVPDIHSPSRVFRWIGQMMMKGLHIGITQEGKHTKRAIKWIIYDAITNAKNVQGNFESFGASISDKIARALDGRKESVKVSFQKSIGNALKGKKSGLSKELEKLLDTKNGKAQIRKATAIYNRAISNAFAKLSATAKKKINGLAKTFQKAYDAIIENRSDMRSMLLSHGDLLESVEEQNESLKDSIESTTEAVEEASLSGLRALNGFDVRRTLYKNIKNLRQYGDRLRALKGRIPEKLMQQIVSMGVEEGNGYAKRLLKLSSGDLAEYVANYQTQTDMALAIEKEYGEKKEQLGREQLAFLKEKEQEEQKFKLRDLGGDILAMQDFNSKATALKGKKIPASLMKEIIGMDLNTANTYMGELLNLGDGAFNDYILKWNEKEKLAKKISDDYYKDGIKKINKKFAKELKKELKTLEKDMSSVGELTVKALAKSINRNGDLIGTSLSEAVRKALVEAKKELGIEAAKSIKNAKSQVKKTNSKATGNTVSKTSKTKNDTKNSKPKTTTINTTIAIDGKAVAKATTKHIDKNLGDTKKRKER